MNPAETETMVITKGHVDHSIKPDDAVLKQGKEFKSLGAVLSNGKPDKDLNEGRRIWRTISRFEQSLPGGG